MKATWRINYKCNFDCVYCWPGSHGHCEQSQVGVLTPRHVVSFFEKESKEWEINITGGEPFLYPDFVYLAKLLTNKFKISLNTNLTSKHVYEFARIIDPDQVIYSSCSSHINECE